MNYVQISIMFMKGFQLIERAKLKQIEQKLLQPEIWNNPSHAAKLNKKASDLHTALQPWLALEIQIAILPG